MRSAANRILLAFKEWEDRKKEMEPLIRVGATDDRMLATLQLDHLRQANYRLRGIVRPDEKPFLVLLDNYVAKLEKQLYPNVLIRLILQLKDRLIDQPAQLKKQQQQRMANMANLKNHLKASGLGSIAGRLENHLDPDQKAVRLPLDCQLGPDKRMSLTLNFEKDPYGNFQLNQLEGSLLQSGIVVKAHGFELNNWPSLKIRQVWGLLEGRAVKQDFTDVSGHENSRWVELGEKGLQHYDPQYPSDLSAELNKLPITRNKDEMMRDLEGGQMVSAYWKKDGQFQPIYLQADPGNQGIKLFDAKQKPTTAEQLNLAVQQQSTAKKDEVPVQRMRKGVKNGHQH